MKLFALTAVASAQFTTPAPQVFGINDANGEHENTIGGIDYYIGRRRGLDWGEARDYCENRGQKLVEFQDEAQYNAVWQWLDSLSGSGVIGQDMLGQAYWIGYKQDKDNNLRSMMNLDNPFTRWSAGEPNDKVCANKSKPAGCEQCIRMRNGGGMTDMNDAICGNTWAGPAHELDPMSFICQSDFPSADYDDSPLCPSAYRGQSQPDSGCYVQNLQWDGSGQQNIQCDMLNPLCLDVTCSPTGMTAKLRADLFHTHQLNLDTIQQQLIAGGTAVGGTGRDLLVNGIRVPHQSQTQNTDLYFTVTNEFVVVNWSYQSTQVAAVASLDHLDSCAGEGDNAIGYTISFTAPGNSAENNQDIEFYVDTTVHATCQYCTNFDIEAENFWVNQEDVNAIQQDYGSLAPLFDCKLFSDSNRQPGSELTDDNIVNMGETIYGEVTSSENLPDVKYRLVEFKVTDGTNPQNSYNVVDANVAQTDVSASKDPNADTGSSLFFQYMSFGFQGNANQNVLINQCKIELYLDNGNGK